MYALTRILTSAAFAALLALVVAAAVALVGGVSFVAAAAWSLIVAGAALAVYPAFMFSGARPRPILGMESAYVRHGLHRPRDRSSRGSALAGTTAGGCVVLAVGLLLLLAT